MKNFPFIIVIILIVIVGILYFLFYSPTEEPPLVVEEDKYDFLNSLEIGTGIDFSDIENLEFKWVVSVDPKVEDVIVTGRGFEAGRISDEQYGNIESFFIEQGFEVDLYNLAAGTISELTGYKKDKIVCTIAGGATGYKEAEGQWIPPEPDIKNVEIKCGEIEEIDETAYWQIYKNEKHGYSFKYPADCLYGPLPGYCKQSPPEERPKECRCYLNGEDSNEVSLGTFTGTKSNLSGASFVISHYLTNVYSPPAGTDFIEWLKENFSYQDIPDDINNQIDGIPAVKVYTPKSPMAWSQEDIYFIKDDKLFKISMLDVDNEDNRELYNKILTTFSIDKVTPFTLVEALEIAKSSECAEKGDLTDNYMYNENTKTWWIDLDMKEEFKKEICNPACVVSEDTKTAEINWRCTGVLP